MSKYTFDFNKVSDKVRSEIVNRRKINGIVDSYGEYKDIYLLGLYDGVYDGVHDTYNAVMHAFSDILKDNQEISLKDAMNLLKKK